VAFLLRSKRAGVSFEACATIGRQGLDLSPSGVRGAFRAAGLEPPDRELTLQLSSSEWAEPLLTHLGASTIVSFDASDFEGATERVDLNLPIPDRLRESFSCVIDVGTLEHIFNFPVAIQNLMQLVKPGGHLLLITPSNNEAGHGFFQFSPELLFRVFERRFGFALNEMLVHEPGRLPPRWYQVTDPAAVGSRAEFRSRKVTYMYVRSQRVGSVSLFDPFPQQSDYSAAWKHGGVNRPVVPLLSEELVRRASNRLPSFIERRVRGVGRRLFGESRLFRRYSYRRLPSHFRPMSLSEVPTEHSRASSPRCRGSQS
jgi:SAM-dependent methyltransferase